MKYRFILNLSVLLLVFGFALPAGANHCTKESRGITYGCPTAPGQIVCGDAPNFSCYTGGVVNEAALDSPPNPKHQEFSCSSCTVQCKSGFYDCDADTAGCEREGSLAGQACTTTGGLAGTWSDACGTNCSVTVEYVQRQQVFPGNPESGHVNVLGNIKGGGYLHITGTSNPTNAPKGSLYYNETAGLKVNKGTQATPDWQDVGKSYSAGTNIDSTALLGNMIKVRTDPTFSVVNIGTGPTPIVSGALRVGASIYLNGGQALRVGGGTDTGSRTLYLLPDTPATSVNLNIGGGLTIDTNTLFVDATNNRVGIGTTTTTKLLTVAGDGVIANLDVGKNLKVVNSGAFGNYTPDPNWKVTTPNLFVGEVINNTTKGTIIGAGSDQGAGDIKTDRHLVVGGNFVKLVTDTTTGTTNCPADTALDTFSWVDLDGDTVKEDGECYQVPTNISQQGLGVFGGRLQVSKLLSSVGGLTVGGPTTIFDPGNLVLAGGNLTAKQVSATKLLTVAPTPDDTVTEQYALRVVDNIGNEWFSVKRTGSVGNATVSADTVHVSTLGSFDAAKLSSASRFDTPELVVNAANTFGLPAGTKFFVNGDSKLQGKLTVVGEFNIDTLKTPTVHFPSTSNPFHIKGDEMLRIQPDVKLNGRLVLVDAVKDENNNEIISAAGNVHLSRLVADDFDTTNEGSLVLMAQNNVTCTTVCNYHKLSCNANVGVIRFDTFNKEITGTSCSNDDDRRICPCGPPQIQ